MSRQNCDSERLILHLAQTRIHAPARYPLPVRLWLKDSERRTDPAPVQTDDRKAMLVGLALWLVALVVVLLFGAQLAATGLVLWTCVAGLVLGVIGLLYTHYRHKN
jgi:VIT1/CCC1 family predicted Fe2+/Mn2+ transporter